MKLVKTLCLLDIAVTAWLAIPGLAQQFFVALYWLDGQLGLDSVQPDFAPLHWMLVNLAGALGVLWNSARLRDASGQLHRIDAWARLWVGGVLLYYVVFAGVTPVILAFVATELLGSAAWLQARRQ